MKRPVSVFLRWKELVIPVFFLLLLNASYGQNVDGEDHVCAGETYSYRADPLGGTHKTWAVLNGTIVGGTKYDDEIQVVWASGATYADISWVAYPGGDGGSMQIFVTTPAAPSSLVVDCVLGTNTVEAEASSVAGASLYYWTITGFGLTAALTTTTSTPSLSAQVPDTNVSGTVCVKAYFPVCGYYGAQTCESYP